MNVTKYTCVITTVDPSTSSIRFVTKGDAQERTVILPTVPVAFRWPVVGETWMVRQENGSWYLDSVLPTDGYQAVEAGDAIINSATGRVQIIGSSADFSFDETGIVTKATWSTTGLSYFTGAGTGNWQDYSPPGWAGLQYAIDSLGFAHLRGAVKNTSAVVYPTINVKIATLPNAIWPSSFVRIEARYFDTGTGHGESYAYIDHTNGVVTMGGVDFANNGSNNGLWSPLWLAAQWIPGT